jgi:hypothetical protein
MLWQKQIKWLIKLYQIGLRRSKLKSPILLEPRTGYGVAQQK